MLIFGHKCLTNTGITVIVQMLSLKVRQNAEDNIQGTCVCGYTTSLFVQRMRPTGTK